MRINDPAVQGRIFEIAGSSRARAEKAFGFPCNDFSIVGEQKGFDGSFGPLYSYGVKVLQDKKPQWFLAENVGGLQSETRERR